MTTNTTQTTTAQKKGVTTEALFGNHPHLFKCCCCLSALNWRLTQKYYWQPRGGFHGLCDINSFEGRKASETVIPVHRRLAFRNKYFFIFKQVYQCIDTFLRYALPQNHTGYDHDN